MKKISILILLLLVSIPLFKIILDPTKEVVPFQSSQPINYKLDIPITVLNNHTLQEVFEDILTDWNRQLPNGVFTYQQRFDNGAYVMDKYISDDYILLSSDLVSMTTLTNVDIVRSKTNLFTNHATWAGGVDGKVRVNGLYEISSQVIADIDKVENIGKVFMTTGSGQEILFVVTKGTSLADSRTLYAGKIITYQLATPILNVWSSALTVEQMDYWYNVYVENKDNKNYYYEYNMTLINEDPNLFTPYELGLEIWNNGILQFIPRKLENNKIMIPFIDNVAWLFEYSWNGWLSTIKERFVFVSGENFWEIIKSIFRLPKVVNPIN